MDNFPSGMKKKALSLLEAEFLARLADGKELPLADRTEDRARRKMRKAGYAKVLPYPRRWVITDEGLLALLEDLAA